MSRQDVRARERSPFQKESISVFHTVWLSKPVILLYRMFPRAHDSPPEVQKNSKSNVN